MKNTLLAVAFLISSALPIHALATTYFSGEIAGAVTWTKEEGPYVVGYVTIPSGASLTILPGTIVKVRAKEESWPILVGGTLTVGIPESNEPVVFTSIKDDFAGGDTNGDGDATLPHAGDWRSITIEPGGIASITRAVFRYGGADTGYDYRCIGPCGYRYFTQSQLFNHGGTLVVDASSFEHTLFTHIEQSAGSSTITGSDLIGASLALNASGGSLTLSRNHFFSNTRGFNITRTALTLTSNIFIETPMNDLDLNATSISDGQNSTARTTTDADETSATALRVSGVIDGRAVTLIRDGFVYVLAGVSIAPTGALTIAPGAIVKMHPSAQLTVYGALTVGDSASPLWTFVTSFRDDEWGGDTNGDGSATGPAQGDWANITVESGGIASIARTTFRYGGADTGYEYRCIGPCGYRYSTQSQLFNHGGELEVDSGRFSSARSAIDTRGGETIITRTDLTGTTQGTLLLSLGTLTMEWSSVHDIASGTVGFNVFGIGVKTANVIGNWWGSATGPTHTENASGTGALIDGEASYIPWLTEPPDLASPVFIAPATTTIPARLCTENCVLQCTINCNSSVLFLPGIEASRLYRPDYSGGTDQLWEPNAQSDVTDLFLTDAGKSVRNDIYTKDVVDEINISPLGQSNIYKSFLADLDTWKNDDHLIADYAAIPYDWRLSLADILKSGHDINGRIYYSGDNAATTTPFIIQELRRLAASSRTGKVTIIAHSNGGLLAKALTKELGDALAALLIDKIIFVAVPQLGAPMAVGALLHGYEQGLPKDWFPLVLIPKTARTFASTSPMAYHLLPSAAYFSGEGAAVRTPLVTFDDGVLTQPFIDAYGRAIGNPTELHNFLIGSEGRIAPAPSDIKSPSVLNSTLLAYGEGVHQDLDDNWTPPASIPIHQIAGWGEDTLSGIRYWTGSECIVVAARCVEYRPKLEYTPLEVVDGDGTVVVPSALAMSTSTANVSRWWVNLRDYGASGFLNSTINRKHADILEVPELRTLTKNILTNSSNPSFEFISTTQPTALLDDDRLRFTLHSPLNLSATDTNGGVVDSATSTIPGSRYKRYGEVQVLSLPLHTPITLHLDGYASGSFTLDIQEIDSNNNTISSTTILAIPSSTSTEATMSFPDGTLANASPLVVDYDGDTVTDFVLTPKVGEIVTLPADTTPPEALIVFSTSTNSILVTGTDDQGIPAVSSTTTYPVLRKNQKERRGIATTTITITDAAGNTTILIYIEELPSPARRDAIVLVSVGYNGVVTKLTGATLKYKWNTNKKGDYTTFGAHLKTASTTLESHYRPKKGVTMLMTKPADFDDRNDDGDDVDARPTKQRLHGMVVPGFVTNNGIVSVNY